jgi:hypothetical protein
MRDEGSFASEDVAEGVCQTQAVYDLKVFG